MATKKAKTEGKQIDKAVQEARLAELAKQINEGHSQCMAAIRTSLERAREIGEALQEAKVVCKQQVLVNFTAWLKGNSRVSECQSQRYMKIAKNWNEIQKWMNSEKDGDLTISKALKYLSSKVKGNKKKSEKKPASDWTKVSSDKLQGFVEDANKVEFDKESPVGPYVEERAKQIAHQIVRLVEKETEFKIKDGATLDKKVVALATLRELKRALKAELLFDMQEPEHKATRETSASQTSQPSDSEANHHRQNGKAKAAVV